MFILKINIKSGTGDSAAVGNFLEGCIFVTFFNKNIERFLKYFLLALVVLNYNCHLTFSLSPVNIERGIKISSFKFFDCGSLVTKVFLKLFI